MSGQERAERSASGTGTELGESLAVVMTDVRRRRVLSALATADGRRSFDDLTDAVAAETSTDDGCHWSDSKEGIAASLHHCHLPKLAQYGLVEHDGPDGETKLTTEGAACLEALGVN